MMKFQLIKNVRLYAPEDLGVTDLLLCGEKTVAIGHDLDPTGLDVEVTDGCGLNATPGLIDQHVHIIGGGGQTGFFSLASEVPLSRLVACGTTTVIGLLGTQPLPMDEIIDRSQLPAARALAAITLLEVKQYIRRLPGKRFTLGKKR